MTTLSAPAPPAPARDLAGINFVGDGFNQGVRRVDEPTPAPRRVDTAARAASDLARLDDRYRHNNPLASPRRDEFATDAACDAALARLTPDRAATIAGSIRTQIEAIGQEIASTWRHALAAKDIAGGAKPAPERAGRVFPLVRRRAKLRALAAVLDGLVRGEAIAYTSPAKAEVDSEFADLVVKLELVSADAFAGLIGLAEKRRNRLAQRAGEVAELISGAFAGADAEKSLVSAAALESEADELAAELAEADRALSEIGPALGKAIAAAVESSGGAKAVAAGLGECRVMDGASLDVPEDAAKLRGIEVQLSAFGATPTSSNPGRLAAGLQAQHREVSADIAKRRKAARKALEDSAVAEVDAALAGDVDSYLELAKAARRTPDAFDGGLAFADALDGAALAAVESVGPRAFAASVGFCL